MTAIRVHALSVILLLGGCAAGKTVDYHTGKSNFSTQFDGDVKLLFAMHDRRPYVTSGRKSPSFVGLSRALNGIPYSVYTKSGRPLAKDFGDLIANTLAEKEYDVRTMEISVHEKPLKYIKKQARADDKVLILSVLEWKTDTYITTSIYYNMTLSVYASDGHKLASVSTSGKDALGSKQRAERQTLANAVVDIVGGLMNEPNIIAAVNNNKRSQTKVRRSKKPSSKSCTTDQILSMKSTGMEDRQIKLACGM